MSKTYKHQNFYDFLHGRNIPMKEVVKWKRYCDWVNFGDITRWLKYKNIKYDQNENNP